MTTRDTNLSTEHQKPGDAKRPSDTLDREQASEGGTSVDDTAGSRPRNADGVAES